jgi:hypothetical protein
VVGTHDLKSVHHLALANELDFTDIGRVTDFSGLRLQDSAGNALEWSKNQLSAAYDGSIPNAMGISSVNIN